MKSEWIRNRVGFRHRNRLYLADYGRTLSSFIKVPTRVGVHTYIHVDLNKNLALAVAMSPVPMSSLPLS